MNELTLRQRTKKAIEDARISPRILAKVTKIHFTTIYTLLRDDEAEKTANPLTIEVLNRTLDGIDKLMSDGKLPFDVSTTHAYRAEELEKLLDNTD